MNIESKNSLLRQIVTASGGTPAPGDSFNDLLRKWCVAEGGTFLAGDSDNRLMRKILTARGGSPAPGDSCNDLLRKICGSGFARSIWDWLRHILALVLGESEPPPDPGAWYASTDGLIWLGATDPENAHALAPTGTVLWMSQQAALPEFPSSVDSLVIEFSDGQYAASYGQLPTYYNLISDEDWADTAIGVQDWIANDGNPFVDPPPGLVWSGTPTVIPDAPVATAASSVGQTALSANWNAATGATGYRLDVSQVANFATFVAENLDVGNVTTYGVTGVAAGVTCYYRVRAYSLGGTSVNSNSISQLMIPPNPVAISATQIETFGFKARWNAATGATSYRIDLSPDEDFSSFVHYNLNAGASTSLTFDDLDSGVNYYYRVRAVNATGTSGNSNTINQATD